MLEQSCHVYFVCACTCMGILGNGKCLHLVCFLLISNIFGTVCWCYCFQNHHALRSSDISSRWGACHVFAGDAPVFGVGLRGNQHYQRYHCGRPVWVQRQGFITRRFTQEEQEQEETQAKHKLRARVWWWDCRGWRVPGQVYTLFHIIYIYTYIK